MVGVSLLLSELLEKPRFYVQSSDFLNVHLGVLFPLKPHMGYTNHVYKLEPSGSQSVAWGTLRDPQDSFKGSLGQNYFHYRFSWAYHEFFSWGHVTY